MDKVQLNLMGLSLLVLIIYGVLLFILSIVKKNNGIADVGWGPGFVLLAWFNFYFSAKSPFHYIFVALFTIWGLRLGTRIYFRGRLLKEEDRRYKQWRDQWGSFFLVRSYFQIYLLQPLLLLLNGSIIVLYLSSSPAVVTATAVIGLLVWAFGFSFEVISDLQLDRFTRNKSTHSKAFLDTGLWNYSRHPNYFGEVMLWWGLYLYAFSNINWALGLISPFIITILILFVSGIPMAEARRRNDPEFQIYMKRTSVFFPLPSKDNP